MRTPRHLTCWLIVAFALSAFSRARAIPPPPSDAADTLHQIFHDDWERQLAESPVFASTLGDRRWNGQWDDATEAAHQRAHDADAQALQHLHAAVNRKLLDTADLLNYDLFERELQVRLDGFRFRTWLMPVRQNGGPQTLSELAVNLRFSTEQDFVDWISRIRGVPQHLDQVIVLLREGMKEGRVPPKILMQRVPPQIAKQLVDAPDASPFFRPFKEMPASIPAERQVALRADALAAIKNGVLPAYAKFQKFFLEKYQPACRDTIAATALPDGAAYYAYRVRTQTTTDLTPLQIHDLGQSEVKRIHEEMDRVMRSTGFTGTFQEFLQFLRTDPRFYFKTGDELLTEYRATAKRIDPELVKLFGHLPRTPYGVRPIPDATAPDTTAAYYNEPAADGSRPGWYSVNLYKPESRPKYEIEALTSHESVPGHHLQLAIQQELGELPPFRRYGGFTAFIEGWGLYSESLGGELGLYKDPYSKFGQLTYEMWRAVRLVVDTGMHQLGWTRQQSIDFFKANAAKTELDIVNEVDRYIATPGQALAYKIGELKIKELRKRAETELGEKFDVRAFHDVVLGSGALPLDLLEGNVERWIEGQKAGH
jgi:prolyl oligopeptidase